MNSVRVNSDILNHIKISSARVKNVRNNNVEKDII